MKLNTLIHGETQQKYLNRTYWTSGIWMKKKPQVIEWENAQAKKQNAEPIRTINATEAIAYMKNLEDDFEKTQHDTIIENKAQESLLLIMTDEDYVWINSFTGEVKHIIKGGNNVCDMR